MRHPDVVDAVELLTADLSGPFDRLAGCEHTVKDKRNGVLINLLPAGRVLKAGCKVPFPLPQQVWDQPRFVPLENLLSLDRSAGLQPAVSPASSRQSAENSPPPEYHGACGLEIRDTADWKSALRAFRLRP